MDTSTDMYTDRDTDTYADRDADVAGGRDTPAARAAQRSKASSRGAHLRRLHAALAAAAAAGCPGLGVGQLTIHGGGLRFRV